MGNKVRRYTWCPDVPDHRDIIFKLKASTLPDKVDIIGKDNPIEDQGNLGSCTGNSSTSMLEIKLGTQGLSRLFAYYSGRLIEGTVNQDSGCQIRDVIKGLMQYGVAQETVWPYTISKFKTKPSTKAYTDAQQIIAQITAAGLQYQRVTCLEDLLHSLSLGNPVTFGFSVPQSFENLPKSGVLAMPKKKEAMIGGHAVVAVGYDSTKSFVWVRNSWGPNWGLNGYFKMPFKYFTDERRLVDDMWTLIQRNHLNSLSFKGNHYGKPTSSR